MNASDIRELSDHEISERIAQAKEELFRLRFRSATQQLENPALIRSLRRDVARLNTIMKERQSQSPSTSAAAPPRTRTRTRKTVK